ncbi:DUF4189 domain-containing protein [Stenotrophomonas daejeonensis]|uniref:DUF4189 domain-containing protein n=1 Tax=Stenotrophomonas daejeonensis TaxID=659018 RepID=UPI001FE15A56|nr:DUF4189 domain-containing protein [Stenotrophomonas daejeonensis]
MSRVEAERVAVDRCAAEGGRDCAISMAYHNQCVAFVVPSSGKGQGSLVRGPVESEVLESAIAKCSDTGGGSVYDFIRIVPSQYS